MFEFEYKAKDRYGRTIKGKTMASTREELVMDLSRKDLTIVSVTNVVDKEKTFDKALAKIPIGGGRVRTFELILLCRLLATMLQGGVPILDAMESIAHEVKNPKFRRVLDSINQDLREGKTVSETFKKYPDVFSNLFTAIVEAGEKVDSKS